MIRRFLNKGLEELFNDGKSKHINKGIQRACVLILDALWGATCPADLVGVKQFHALKGDRAGYYTMHVNGNFCITFQFDGNDVTDVDIEDYH